MRTNDEFIEVATALSCRYPYSIDFILPWLRMAGDIDLTERSMLRMIRFNCSFGDALHFEVAFDAATDAAKGGE